MLTCHIPLRRCQYRSRQSLQCGRCCDGLVFGGRKVSCIVERDGAFSRSLPDLNAFLIGAGLRFLTTFDELSSPREQEEPQCEFGC